MKKRDTKLFSEINITPLTDVVLVLLIIFMITTPLIIQTGIKVKLPKAKTIEVDTAKSINVVIDASGDVFVENTRINFDSLGGELSARVMNNPDALVVVKGDMDTKYDNIIKVLDIAKQSGVKKFALATDVKR